MPIDYNQYLTDEQKRSLLQQRIQQFAAEAFQHEINKKFAAEIGNEQGVVQADEALVMLDAAITLHLNELDVIENSQK